MKLKLNGKAFFLTAQSGLIREKISINICRKQRAGPEQAKQANNYVTKMAKEVGLNYDFNKVVVANTFDAHRLIQLGKANKKSGETQERLFKAYFIEGRNIADDNTLKLLGTEVGLPVDAIKKLLNSDEYSHEVEKDIIDAHLMGVRAVPYFVFNDQYAVSGAQRKETFLDTLNRAWHEWENRKPELKL